MARILPSERVTAIGAVHGHVRFERGEERLEAALEHRPGRAAGPPDLGRERRERASVGGRVAVRARQVALGDLAHEREAADVVDTLSSEPAIPSSERATTSEKQRLLRVECA